MSWLVRPTEYEYATLRHGYVFVYDFIDLLWIHGAAYMMAIEVLL